MAGRLCVQVTGNYMQHTVIDRADRPPRNHLVILRPPYLDMILSGEKTVESRLSLQRHPAATRCLPGDRLYLKRTGGGIECRATVARIDVYAGLDVEALRAVSEEWAGRVAA